MDRALQFVLSEQAYLHDALRVLRTARTTGVLRLVMSQVNGRIAVRDGQPCAAHNGTTGSAGDAAVAEMLDAGVGIFHFAEVELPANLADYAISPRNRERIEQMAEEKRIGHFDEMFSQFVGTLPAEEQQLLSMFRRIQKEDERETFLEQNPQFLQHGSLNDEKLKVVRLYSQLNDEIDKRAFLKSNPLFHEVMMNATGLTDEQRKDLVKGQYAAIERDLEFGGFCRQLFGKTYPDLNEDQAVMLKATFLRLTNEQDRKAFLEANPLLSEDAPVLRGEEVLPYVRLDAPPPEESQLSDEERLAAQKLQAVDLVVRASERKVPYLRLRDLQSVAVAPPVERKPTATRALLSLAVVSASLLLAFYVFLHGKPSATEQSSSESRSGIKPLAPPAVDAEIPESYSIKAPVRTRSGDNNTLLLSGPSAGDDDRTAADKLIAAGRYDEAAARMESYVAKNPNSASANIALVRCYLAGKKKKKARMLCIKIFKTTKLSAHENDTLTSMWRAALR